MTVVSEWWFDKAVEREQELRVDWDLVGVESAVWQPEEADVVERFWVILWWSRLEKEFFEDDWVYDWAQGEQVSPTLMVAEKMYDGDFRFAVTSIAVVSFLQTLLVNPLILHPNRLFRFPLSPVLIYRINVHPA
jgi:hypothetical protein